ncbi:MAG TPA: lytic murein transglycosylase [Alphaproteobacteria bacterium]|jgi:membrane-bound lytic murein transglycosylase B|nr:lytic murein transglycosylase [Alphaproteobacteria bacterium]
MKSYGFPHLALAFGLMLGLAGPAHAQAGDFMEWLAGLKRDAAAQGVPAATLDRALTGVQPLPRVLELDQKQPESTMTLGRYINNVVKPERIEKGRQLKVQDKAVLHSVSDRYGVPTKVIMALWAVESGFGVSMGSFRVVDALATLAFDGRRPELFRSELINALKILSRGHFESEDLKGSWAGAMGQVQFMPSTYLHYAVAYEHAGQPDIWHGQGDVFASAANYLSTLGWKRDESWGREVALPAGFDAGLIGLKDKRTVSEWSKLGVRRLGGAKLPASTIEGSIVQPDGAGGRAFLVYDNFRVIMKWNHSTYFAVAVNMLADGIGN